MEDCSPTTTAISEQHIRNLLKRFSAKAYSSKLHEDNDERIIDICIQLWQLDYRCEIIENKNGSLCSTYPSRIIVPVYEVGVAGEVINASPLSDSVFIEVSETQFCKNDSSESQKPDLSTNSTKPISTCNSEHIELCQTNNKSEKNAHQKVLLAKENPNPPTFSAVVANSKSSSKKVNEENSAPCKGSRSNGSLHKLTLREYFNKANLARCRYRFPIPSILCKGKYVSRSATLSCFIDVLGKQILHSSELDSPHNNEDEFDSMPRHSNDLDRARFYDIKLLEAIGTSSILDLMVENKKVKYNINVSSSEKADKENRYSKFGVTSIPYPGCEFFKEFTNQHFNSSQLFYNWDQPFNDASLYLAEESMPQKVTADWANYKNWDLRKLTENYLKLVLKYILDDDSKESGFLIHCISGWDRTPLFISLVRLSLWADGIAHCSLDANQILYLTLSYDWYLFGHQLPDRLKSKENILYFCFEFLDEISKDSFAESLEKRERHPSNGSFTSTTYDSATGGILTPSSWFGSAASLASSSLASSSLASSSPPPSGLPSGPPPSGPPIKTTTSSGETCQWPFDKENGFTFEGMSENGGGGGGKKGSPPNRSPLKERNKGGGGGKGGRKVTLNGFVRDLATRRSRKSSSPSSRGSSGSEAPDYSNTQPTIVADGEPLCGEGLVPSSSPYLNGASKPVPVPVAGGRSRHNSCSSSSVGSWQLLSTSEALKEAFSCDSHRSSRTSLAGDLIDSTTTIKEEATPSTSLESSQSIIVFNRGNRLREVRKTFMDAYAKEISPMYPDWSFITDIVQNFYHKLST